VPPSLIRFDAFELNCAGYELRKNGRTLRLEKIPMELLILLTSRYGCLVTRREIAEHLWGSKVFVDTEHGINTAVRKIRQVLGDDPDRPRFVQTVQGKGYRFIAEAAEAEDKHEQRDGAAKSEAVFPSHTNASGPMEPSRPTTTIVANNGAAPSRRAGRRVAWIGIAAGLLLTWPAVRFAWPHFASRAAQPRAIRSIAVLPLENTSSDPTQDYYAAGITDELIASLARYQSVRIISAASVTEHKKARPPLGEIARELGVDAIIEGSVSRSHDRVRVSAQMVYAPTNMRVWAESYDRALGDLASLQQDLATSIAESVRLPPSVRERLARPMREPINLAARDAYFRGRYYWFSDHYKKSREFFEQAIQLDPTYAAAYSGLADSYLGGAMAGVLPPRDAMPKGEVAAKKAIELDDSLPEAHNSLAAAKLFYRWDWQGAEKESERAINLNPSLAEAHHLRSYVLSVMNRMDEAVEEERLTMELNPFARPWAYGYALLRARRFDDALQEFKQRAEAQPESVSLHQFLSLTYCYKGDDKAAFEELERSLMLEGDQATVTALKQLYRQAGFQAVQNELLKRLKNRAEREYVSPFTLAAYAAQARQKEEAIHYLQAAFEEHAPHLVHLQHQPEFDFLHSDPRYWDIVRKMGLPPLD
jgi:TolB-like protein/DNA-binding winged helix-turn-helix (wHTH) protein/Tfp pilus assembly protein PilF